MVLKEIRKVDSCRCEGVAKVELFEGTGKLIGCLDLKHVQARPRTY